MGFAKRVLSSAFIFAALGFFNIGQAESAPLPKLPADEVAKRMLVYDHTPLTTKPNWNYLGLDSSGCGEYEVRIPVDGVSFRFLVHLPYVNGAVPAVIHIPTIEGETPLEDFLAKRFCNLKVAFIVADVQPNDVSDGMAGPAALQESLVLGVRAVRTMIDHLYQYPTPDVLVGGRGPSTTSINLQRIGTLGISNGTITAAMAAAADSRIESTLLFAMISNVPHAMAYSTNSKVKAVRQEWMRQTGITNQAALELHLRQYFELSPLDVMDLLEKKRVHQIVIDRNKTAPDVDQFAFYNGMRGRPYFSSDIRFSIGHVPTIVYVVTLDITAISDFFY